jgi:DNA-directed RNA polymerase subunit RPC12/RpoP
MLISCPECWQQVSDRAKACPDCGFPVSEHVAEQRELDRRKALVASRERVGEIDCPRCQARGFVNFSEVDEDGVTQQLFAWCSDCKHSGRVHQCRDLDGFHAVSYAALEGFLAGSIDPEADGVTFVGTEQVVAHRYPQAGKIWDDD